MKIRSKYKYFGGVGLIIGLNVYIAYSLWLFAPKAHISLFSIESWQNEITRIAMFFFLGIQAIFLWLFISQCKFIIVSDKGITFVNPVLPFLRKTRLWREYDCFQTVIEGTLWARHESVWLIKDNVLKERFSSFYYTNYSEIKHGIKAENRGELKLGQYRQLLCWWGFKIKK